jgi:hypothetical protein
MRSQLKVLLITATLVTVNSARPRPLPGPRRRKLLIPAQPNNTR